MLHQPVTTHYGEEEPQREPKLAKQIVHDLDHSHARLFGYWKDGNLEVSLEGVPAFYVRFDGEEWPQMVDFATERCFTGAGEMQDLATALKIVGNYM